MSAMKGPVGRGLVLFSIGVFLALVLNLLQVQRQVTVFPPEVLASLFSSAWWVPPSCGTAAGMDSCPLNFAPINFWNEVMRLPKKMERILPSIAALDFQGLLYFFIASLGLLHLVEVLPRKRHHFHLVTQPGYAMVK